MIEFESWRLPIRNDDRSTGEVDGRQFTLGEEQSRPAAKEKQARAIARGLLLSTASSRPARYRRSRSSACSNSGKRFAEPHGQRSFPSSFSASSLSPWTIRSPRRTFVSDGYPSPPFTCRLERRGGSRIRRGAPCRASSQLLEAAVRGGECRRRWGFLLAPGRSWSVRGGSISGALTRVT